MRTGARVAGQPTSPRPVRLLDLTPGRCRWPIGGPLERAEFFCGQPAVEHCSWCGKHRDVAFTKSPLSSARRAHL
jgi:hypothetical protein